MRVKQDEPFEIQPRANGAMANVLQRLSVIALGVGLAGTLLPGPLGEGSAWAAFGLVVAAPLARVGWLAVRWIARRDYLFSLIAFGLLLVVVVGGVLAIRQAAATP